jgi:hypothetical protein
MSSFACKRQSLWYVLVVIATFFNIAQGYVGIVSNAAIGRTARLNRYRSQSRQWMCDNNAPKGFGSQIPKPRIIVPSKGNTNAELEKFMMMYTCKICNGRNAQMVSKVAYNYGMVVSSCKHCKNKHLIADNEGKLDMAEYGKKMEDYLRGRGEAIQRISVTAKDLEDNYLIDKDGVLSLVPKVISPPCTCPCHPLPFHSPPLSFRSLPLLAPTI